MALGERRFRGFLAWSIVGLLSLTIVGPAVAQPAGQPIRVGGTLSLTGPLAVTSMVHKIVGEIYVERLNKRGGLLGRPVEWVLLDDQSKPELARSLYEKVITVDKVDALIGPYGTGNILAAMAVAERHGKTLPHHTFGIPKLAKYERQFPIWPFGPVPEETFPNRLFDALASTGKPPKTITIVTSKFPSVHFWSVGARDVAKKRGLQEVLFLEYEFGTRDFGPLAVRVKEANADLLWMGALNVEPLYLLEALKKLDYAPKRHFYLFPAPGPVAVSPDANHALSVTIFENHPPFTSTPEAAEFAKLYRDRAAKAGLPYQEADGQGAASYATWQVLEASVSATKGLDDKARAQWLRANRVETIIGRLRFDGPNNFGDDLTHLKQVQNGKWVTVWPLQYAAPGAGIILP